MAWFDNLKIRNKLLLSFIVVAIITGIMGIFAVVNLQSDKNSNLDMYEHEVVPLSKMSTISVLFQNGRVYARELVLFSDDPGKASKAVDQIMTSKSGITDASNEFSSLVKDDDIEKEFENFKKYRADYLVQLDKLIAAVKEGDKQKAISIFDGDEARAATQGEQTAIENMVKMLQERAKTSNNNNSLMADKNIEILESISISVVLIAIILGIIISYKISNPIKKTLEMINELEKGHLGMRLKITARDEIGQMAIAMDNFADNLHNEFVGAVKKISEGDVTLVLEPHDENDEITPALNKTINTLKMLINDVNYMSSQQELGNTEVMVNEEKFQGAYSLVAQGVNNMVKDYISLNKQAMDCIAEFGKGNFEAPLEIFKGNKVYINNIIEQVRLNLKALINDAEMLVAAAIDGKLETRADASKHYGDFRKIIEGVNATMDAVIGPVKESATVLNELAKGNLNVMVKGDYKGDHAVIKESLNSTIESLKLYINEISRVVRLISGGDLKAKVELEFKGDFAEIKESLGDVVDSLTLYIGEISRVVKLMSDGDLTAQVELEFKGDFIEIKESFSMAIKAFNKTMGEIDSIVKSLNSSASNMTGVAEVLERKSEETNEQTFVVSAAVEEISAGMTQSAATLSSTSDNISMIASSVEEMSTTIKNLATSAEQASTSANHVSVLSVDITDKIDGVSGYAKDVASSVNSVVVAIKEINASLQQVSNSCDKSIQVTDDAGKKAKDTSEIIKKLNDSSRQIGKVVNLINEIASQTNILALNAAIEAAGAGEAGKGFAVVANEVKQLAKQTAEATDEIQQQIETMQDNMFSAVSAVDVINQVIDEITGITGTIASAVTQQTTTASNIAAAAVSASQKVNEITNEISEVANNAKDVSKNVEASWNGIKEIANSAKEIATASEEAAMNSERASISVNEISRTTQEITRATIDISKNIQEISSTTVEMSNGASDSNKSAKMLYDTAENVSGLVGRFKLN